MARTVEEIEKEIAHLSPEQLREFRAWYEKFDWNAWDKQIEHDVTSGRLDALADAAIEEHKSGKSREL